MRRHRIAVWLGVVTVLALAATAWANIRLRIPQDIQPPFYTTGAGPFFLPDGSIFVIHDDEWVAIPFWRPPACVPAGFNLLDLFDPAATGCPILVEGFAIFRQPAPPPISTEVQGLGAVPIWFVRRSEFQAATADEVLTIGELAALPSLRVGTASFYQEQNHIFGAHPVSHLTIVAHGTLAGGGSFDLLAIEVALELVQVRIVFR